MKFTSTILVASLAIMQGVSAAPRPRSASVPAFESATASPWVAQTVTVTRTVAIPSGNPTYPAEASNVSNYPSGGPWEPSTTGYPSGPYPSGYPSGPYPSGGPWEPSPTGYPSGSYPSGPWEPSGTWYPSGETRRPTGSPRPTGHTGPIGASASSVPTSATRWK
ncbi:MAG: hypothetical protein J3Q66DRAFT_403192 [Benniella sp.]|nr:MAG: hypothetical protein J3Q66DRAFT_403192 [Benniella sp.]